MDKKMFDTDVKKKKIPIKGIKYARAGLVFEDRQDKFHWIVAVFLPVQLILSKLEQSKENYKNALFVPC